MNSSVKKYVTEDEVKNIVINYNNLNDKNVRLEKFTINNASNKMLGFLCDYWRLSVLISEGNSERKTLNFFIKAISRTNAAKANLVTDMKLFDKELYFYTVIKNKIEIADIKPWSPKMICELDKAIVFEDLGALKYKLRNKFERFDIAHTFQALKALARLHASSIIFEEKKTREFNEGNYTLEAEFGQFLNKGGYTILDPWFIQCMTGAFEAVKLFSKHKTNKEVIKVIEKKWSAVWESALSLSDFSHQYRNVICHRDLWNNNILFHYKQLENDTTEPDDCVLVDFQAVRCQPPTGDIMLLLYCNLDPIFREEKMADFLNHYYQELEYILFNHDIKIKNVLNKEDFMDSAEEQRLWGLIVCGCLMPQFWIDEELTTEIFCNTKRFEDILSKNKGKFIINMMKEDSLYREKVMDIFDEIVDRYCIS